MFDAGSISNIMYLLIHLPSRGELNHSTSDSRNFQKALFLRRIQRKPLFRTARLSTKFQTYNENLAAKLIMRRYAGNKTGVPGELRCSNHVPGCITDGQRGATIPFVYSFECRSYRRNATRHYGPIARTTLHIKGPKLQFNLFRTCLGNGIAITGKTIPPFIEACLIALIANYNYYSSSSIHV